MRHIYLHVCITILYISFLNAQTGCPGCVVNVPAGLPADTIYLPAFPDGEQGTPYNQDYSFRMPMTTTPVAAIDSTTPPGLPISKIEILSLDGLPAGLSWEPNQTVFQTATQTDGCIKLCGTPTEADSFVLMVKIKVTVFIITQEVSFPLRLYIAPKVSNTDGFSMTGFTGCGSATPSFINNIPSGGNPGFIYDWNFGDGTSSTAENPPPHTYSAPGAYVVSYHATVDTVGYILQSATVLAVSCVDELGIGSPDLFLLVKNPQGVEIFNSSPDINNTQLPHNFGTNIPLGAGNYSMEVWDEDSGLKGSDDLCGQISFNFLSNDTIVSGGFTVVLNIIHPLENIYSTDTVTVYAQPPSPAIAAPNGLAQCAGAPNPILLSSSAAAGNQWWYNGTPISNATDSVFVPTQSGYYQVQVSTPDGCTAFSDSTDVSVYPLPANPIYFNSNNLLQVTDTVALPAQYSLQWYNGANPIPGETGFRYCVAANGTYGLLVVDESTGCMSFYAATVNFNPAFDCTVGEKSPVAGSLALFPNPAGNLVNILLDQPPGVEATLYVRDLTGRIAMQQSVSAGLDAIQLDCSALPAGVFSLELVHSKALRYRSKLVLIK